MNGTEDYLREGGRLMYLGGNGYYWVTGTCGGSHTALRLESSTLAAALGRRNRAKVIWHTSERSGWRSRGQAPQKIVGLGFTTEGMDMSEPFEQMPDNFHKRVSWILEGVGDEEAIDFEPCARWRCWGLSWTAMTLLLGRRLTMLLASAGAFRNYPLVSEDHCFPG